MEKITAYALGENLEQIPLVKAVNVPSVIISDSENGQDVLEKAGIIYETRPNNRIIGFSKVEARQECLEGTLFIPRLMDVLGQRFRISFYINAEHIVLIDDDNFSAELIERVIRKKTHEGDTKERFLYNYFTEFISHDLSVLVQYEKDMTRLEEDVLNGFTHDFHSRMTPFRKELTALRTYYDELTDLGKALEEDENDFFDKKYTKYFGTVSDRADRLMNRTEHLLNLSQQISDIYQSGIDAKQNANMQYITIVSTIFLPLTLITSWYGMNFQNMPELEKGYPYVIVLSIVVLIICVIIFKRKKFL